MLEARNVTTAPEGPIPVVLSLLVVDDQLSIRRLLDLVATDDPRYGVVVTAACTVQALEQALQHQPDAVLLDAGLGYEDGLMAIGALRSVVPGVVVVVFSSDPFANHTSARRAGADLFVPKGTDVDLLLDLVVREVEERACAPTSGR